MGRRRQSVTIKHVAADAGVSLQTVSRVINNEPNVRAEMKERVQASIDKLGYGDGVDVFVLEATDDRATGLSTIAVLCPLPETAGWA